MSDPTPEAVPAPAVSFQAPAPTEAPEPTSDGRETPPPWGDDFDPQTAWDRLQKVQREAQNLRSRAVSPEQMQQLEDYNRLVEASKSEQQRQAEALEAATRAAESATAEATRYRVAAEHGITRDDFDLLGDGTEEQITARAQRIAEIRTAATPTPPAATPHPGGQRPVEQLRPGATPTHAVSDDDALLAKLFGPPQ